MVAGARKQASNSNREWRHDEWRHDELRERGAPWVAACSIQQAAVPLGHALDAGRSWLAGAPPSSASATRSRRGLAALRGAARREA